MQQCIQAPRCRLGAVCAALVVLVAAGTAAAAEFQRTFTFTGDDLEVVDMIGMVTVVAAPGADFEVTVAVRGDDAAEDLIEFVTEQGRDGKFAVRFPLEDHHRYVYPELGDSKTTITFRDDNAHETSWLKKVFGELHGEKITVSGAGKGLRLWVDVTVAVPAGAGLHVRHGVGGIDARGVAADLELDTHAGGIAVRDCEGDVSLETGSGGVEVAAVRGTVSVDTGSGGVDLNDLAGDTIEVDTGSGGVTGRTLSCRELAIDTGSGGVVASGVVADELKVDTGSGGVDLAFTRLDGGRCVVETGSGGIRLELPPDASARIAAETGSGAIWAEVEGATVEHEEHDKLRMQVGAGAAHVTLEAGSGSITITGR